MLRLPKLAAPAIELEWAVADARFVSLSASPSPNWALIFASFAGLLFGLAQRSGCKLEHLLAKGNEAGNLEHASRVRSFLFAVPSVFR